MCITEQNRTDSADRKGHTSYSTASPCSAHRLWGTRPLKWIHHSWVEVLPLEDDNRLWSFLYNTEAHALVSMFLIFSFPSHTAISKTDDVLNPVLFFGVYIPTSTMISVKLPGIGILNMIEFKNQAHLHFWLLFWWCPLISEVLKLYILMSCPLYYCTFPL